MIDEKRKEDILEEEEEDSSDDIIEDVTEEGGSGDEGSNSEDIGSVAEDAVKSEDTITGSSSDDTISQPSIETNSDTNQEDSISHSPLPKTEEPNQDNSFEGKSQDSSVSDNESKKEEPKISDNAPMEDGMGTGAHTGSDDHISINKDDFWKYLKIIVVVAVLILGYNYFIGDKAEDAGNVIVDEPAGNVPPEVAKVEVSIDDDAIKGDKDAPVTIIEFSDYECPFCARFYTQTLSQIDEQYIKTGKVNLVYRDYPLGFHQQAQKAAEAAECAGEQEKYFDMHDKLFEEGVAGGVASYKQFAGQIGLDQGKFDECLDSGAMAEEVQKDLADGSKYGVQGTPAFFVNGKLISGAQPFSVFQQAIEAELA